MEIKCTGQELGSIITALDFAVRMWIGQYDHIEDVIRWNKDAEAVWDMEEFVRPILLDARNLVFPELKDFSYYGSYGVHNPNRPVKGAIAYDMYQEFRFRQSYFQHPEGGWTVNFDKPLWCADDPCERPTASLFVENGQDMAILGVCREQKDIICDALNAYASLLGTNLVGMFRVFTDNEEALKRMEGAETIYRSIPYDPTMSTKESREEFEKLAEKIRKAT